MPCHESVDGRIHVCAPSATVSRRILMCHNCKRRRRFRVNSYEWYGPDVYCCACGERWSDGEWMPRPFARGWRQENIAYAREAWRRAPIGEAQLVSGRTVTGEG